jgi:hypothetical protein
MKREPIRGEIRHFLQGSGFRKKMACTLHHREPALAA